MPGTDVQPRCYNLVMFCRLGPDLAHDGVCFGDTRPDERLRTTIRYFRPSDAIELARANTAVSNDDLALLVDAARQLVDLHESGDASSNLLGEQYEPMRALVDRLRPPEPPTLDEALQALSDLRGQVESVSDYSRQADELLERAKRAGVLS